MRDRHPLRRLHLCSAALVCAVLAALLVAGAGLASSAQAATYTVGTVSDTPLEESCTEPAAGKCSLRQLIEYENARAETPKEPDVIVVPSGTYELTTGSALKITQSLVILGAGARATTVEVPSNATSRVFDIEPKPTGGEAPAVGIFGLKIAGGTANADELNLGGDIRNREKLVLSEDWITAGTAYLGGGIGNEAGTVYLERSLVSGNHASLGNGEGGGIVNYGAYCPNACSESTRAILALEDSTVAGNDARLGAGILSESEGGSPDENEVSILDSTIAYNKTQEEPACGVECFALGPGAGLAVKEGEIEVSGSIVADNTETTAGEITNTNCAATSPATIVSIFGYDLTNTGEADCPFTSPGDLQNTSPDFSSTELQNNGGNTDTLAPEPDSPAVNAIPTTETVLCTGADQRDISRPQGSGCDIGAVELAAAEPPPPPPPCACAPPTGPTPTLPSLIATSPPSVLSTSSAAFTTTVNPHGLATSVYFEYGPVLGEAKTAAVTYGSVTPTQSVPADFANHTVTATVTGLLPNVTYNVRAVATNSAGSSTGANQALATPADPPPPPPVLGKAVNVTPVSGIVYIKLPPGDALASAASVSPFSSFAIGAQALAALTKGQSFVPLTEARQIPVGSILEATHGVAGITTATTASKKGKLQSGDFGAGIFKLLQKRKQKGLTELDIINNLNAHQVCTTLGKGARIASRHLSGKVLGQLRASGHGNFTARGQDSAATVRGTVWGVKNQCDGTLTHVTRGVVTVRDFIRRKTITLFTGQSYLARGPRP
jgi:hypothetical protein